VAVRKAGQIELLHIDDIDSVVNSVEPQTLQYKRSKDALRQYRALLPQDNTDPVPLVTGNPSNPANRTPAQAVRPNSSCLVTNLPPTPDTTDATTYDRALVDAVKHFQHRHGLAEDGKLGKRPLRRSRHHRHTHQPDPFSIPSNAGAGSPTSTSTPRSW